MEDREEIEKAKEEITGIINLFYEFPNPQCVLLQDSQVQYLETLVQYIDKLEKSDASKEQSSMNYYNEYKKLKQENNKLNKMIDEILVEYELHDRYNLKEFCDEEIRKNKCIENCLECIKQYFEKKVDEN